MPSANKRAPNPLGAFPGLMASVVSAATRTANSAEKAAKNAAQSLAKTAVGLQKYLVKGGGTRRRGRGRRGSRRTRRR